VNGPRDRFLAAAGFAEDEDRDDLGREAQEPPVRLAHRVVGRDDSDAAPPQGKVRGRLALVHAIEERLEHQGDGGRDLLRNRRRESELEARASGRERAPEDFAIRRERLAEADDVAAVAVDDRET
jgi:hypothetical protein